MNIQQLQSLIRHVGFRKYFANTSWLFAEKIVRISVSLFVGIWIARYLGPTNYGVLNYALSFVGLFLALSTLGLDSILVRALLRNEHQEGELLGTTFSLKLFGALLMLLLISATLIFMDNQPIENTLILLIASSTILHSFNVIDFYFQAKVLSKYVVYANMIALLFASLVKIYLIVTEASLVHFGLVILYESIVLALGIIYFYKTQGHSFRNWVYRHTVAKQLLRDSWPLILSTMVIALYMKIDQVMINNMLDNEAVGHYAAAVRLSEVWYFIPVVIANSLFPSILNSKQHSEELYYNRVQKLYSLMVFLALLIIIPMSFLSEWIIVLLFGEQYLPAGDVLFIHIWSAVFIFLLHASGKWLVSENLTKQALYRNITGAIINIALNFYLIQKMGIVGAAISTLISYAIAGFFYDFFDPNLKKSFTLKLNAFKFKQVYTGK